ncbi:hypothetical protein sos41_09640 [Alphaproteobacteria bacterium SO-S41]|nr:hypothetical protein sos41_09640 [Alphaproteobacteria bacterium SO-S41]
MLGWQTLAIIAGVFIIGLIIGRGFGARGGSAPSAPLAAPRLATRAPVAAESGPYQVNLRSAGRNKIAVIKALRELTGLGLKETKDMADGAPGIVLSGRARASAEQAVELLRNAGADAEVV